MTFPEPRWLAVFVAPCPARIVPCSDRDVAVSELLRHIPERDTCREQLGREGVAQVLHPDVADLGPLEGPPPLTVSEVCGVDPGKHVGLVARCEARAVGLL